MTFKCTSGASPATFLDIADGPLLTLPNGDFTWASVVVTNPALPGTGEYIISSGPFAAAGSLSLALNPAAGKVFAYVDTFDQETCVITGVIGPSQTWVVALVRKDNVLYSKACRRLDTLPTDGTAVLTGTSRALTKELDAPRATRIGARSNTSIERTLDQSVGRLFCVHSALTDLEIAKLAHGMTVSDIGKTPVWYIKGDTGSDTFDSGPNALTVTRNTGATPFATGSDPGFVYAPAASRPTFSTAPTITGTPTAGVAAAYAAGTATGTAPITSTFQFLLDDVAIGAAGSPTAYTPTTADVGKTLKIRQTATNTQGSEVSTSAGKVIVAGAVSNTVTVTPPANESIFAHTGGSRVVSMAVACEGATPDSFEIQLYAGDGVTVQKAWATVPFTGSTGAYTITPTIATSLRKQRVAVRSKAAGAVLATSAVPTNRFAVGAVYFMGGSSSSQAWGNLMSGTAFDAIDGEITGQFRAGVWGQGTVRSYGTRMAMVLSAQLGMAVGMVNAGVSGTTLKGAAGWSTFTSSVFTNTRAAIGEVGGKVSGFLLSVGSNDAGNSGGVVSQADHLAAIRLLIQNCRDATNDQSSPVVWVGINRRSSTTATATVFETQMNQARAAENQVGDDANVFHVQTLDYEMHGDNTHLTDAGILGSTTRMGYILAEALAGRYRRGPKIVSLTWQGNRVRAALQHRSGTDITPTSGYTGLTLVDGTDAVTFTTERQSASAFDLVASRTLTAPVVKYMNGGAPDSTTPIYDNGTVPLPTHAETGMAVVAGQLAAPDTTAPTMTGAVTSSAVTATSATIAWPLATDDVAVTGYEYSTNGGTSYVNAGTARTAALTGLTASTTYQLRARAYDAAGNRSSAVSGTLTTLAAADTTVPVFPAGSAISTTNISQTSANIAWPVATDNTAVAGYEYSVNGAGYVSTGTARTAGLTGLASGTQATVAVRAIDAAGNRSQPLTGAFSTLAETTQPTDPAFARSKSRTINIAAAPGSFEQEGKFWTFPNPKRPTGSIDPNATIDITFNWTAVLADISDTIAGVQFDIVGLTNKGGFQNGAFATIFVSNVTGTPSITCRITTASTPPRVEDRTVYLNVEQQ